MKTIEEKILRSEYMINWRNKNKLKWEKYIINWREENKEYHKKLVNNHYHNNKDYYRQWNRNKMDIDPLFRLRHAINALINHHLKEGKSQSSIEYLGCTIQEYKEYLEPKFTPEMNWDNYGTVWNIDHTIPINIFDLKNEEEILLMSRDYDEKKENDKSLDDVDINF